MKNKVDSETVYVVSGHMRTGTSMMMKALEAGGLKAVKRQSREKGTRLPHKDKFYDPNPGGLYELERMDYQRYDFPSQFKGKLIKCLWGGIPKMCAGKYKIIFMMRHPEEIRQSYMAFFNISNLPSIEDYYQRMNNIISIMDMRKDMDYIILNYRSVIENPKKEFQKLKDARWPINIDKCVKQVNPHLCRYKLENLEVGII